MGSRGHVVHEMAMFPQTGRRDVEASAAQLTHSHRQARRGRVRTHRRRQSDQEAGSRAYVLGPARDLRALFSKNDAATASNSHFSGVLLLHLAMMRVAVSASNVRTGQSTAACGCWETVNTRMGPRRRSRAVFCFSRSHRVFPRMPSRWDMSLATGSRNAAKAAAWHGIEGDIARPSGSWKVGTVYDKTILMDKWGGNLRQTWVVWVMDADETRVVGWSIWR